MSRTSRSIVEAVLLSFPLPGRRSGLRHLGTYINPIVDPASFVFLILATCFSSFLKWNSEKHQRQFFREEKASCSRD